MEPRHRQGVYFNTNVAKVTLVKIPDKPGIAADIFGALGARNVNVELVVNTSVEPGIADVAFVVAEVTVPVVQEVMQKLVQQLGGKGVDVDRDVATLSVRAADMGPRVSPGVIFSALAKEGINIEMISSSLWGITCVIRKSRLEDATKAIERLHSD
jgi:aspartate kinase